MRTLGMDDFLAINRMTIPEFELRMKAAELKQLDRIHELHILAWAINQARATKKNGRPVFRTFRSFFDFEKQEKKILEYGKKSELLRRYIQRKKDYMNRKEAEKHGKL